MHPPSHLILSWLVGHRLTAWRDRVLIAWAGLAPDLDGLTLLAGEEMYGRWHHVLTHGLVAALAIAGLAALLARRRFLTATLAFVAFHLHLVCDLLGSGAAWGIVYFYPFSDWELGFRWGWPLASWQNVTITACALAACVYTALRHGRTFAESFLPVRIDREVAHALRERARQVARSSGAG